MAGPVNTLPEAMDGPSLVHAAGRSLSHVGHTGHSSGCSLTATHPLCGLGFEQWNKPNQVSLRDELVLLH